MCHRVLCIRGGFSQLPVCSLGNKCWVLDELCSSWAWKRQRENSLVEEMLVRNTGSCAGSSHKPFLLLLQCFASHLRADQGGTKQNLQHSLLGICLRGCRRNSPGFPSAHKPWCSRLELISSKFSDANISNKLQPGHLLLDCAHLWPGKEYITI